MLAAMPPPPPVLFSTVIGLAEAVRHLVGEQPADDVGAAARRGADQDAERPLRPVLLGAGGQRWSCRESCGERERAAASEAHRCRCPGLKQRNVSREGRRPKTTPQMTLGQG